MEVLGRSGDLFECARDELHSDEAHVQEVTSFKAATAELDAIEVGFNEPTIDERAAIEAGVCKVEMVDVTAVKRLVREVDRARRDGPSYDLYLGLTRLRAKLVRLQGPTG